MQQILPWLCKARYSMLTSVSSECNVRYFPVSFSLSKVCSVPRALQNPLFECFGTAPFFPRADVALGSWSAFEDLSMDVFNSFHGPPSWCLGSGIPWWKDRCKVFCPCCCRTRVSSPTLPVPGGPSDPGMS